jgi:hypothetical protein
VCRAEKAGARVVRVFDLLRHKFARHSMNPVTLVLGSLQYHSDLTSADAYANENGVKALDSTLNVHADSIAILIGKHD